MSKKVTFTIEQYNDLYDLMTRNLTMNQIAQHFCITADTLHRILEENNIPILRTCSICGTVFEVQTHKQLVCNLPKICKCSICGKLFVQNCSHEMRATCSEECHRRSIASDSSKERRIFTNQHRYGVSFIGQSSEIQQRVKLTCLKNFGVSNPSKSRQIRSKIESTNVHRYGAKTCLQNLDILECIKQTNLKRYGATCSLMNAEVQAKCRQTLITRFGVNNIMKCSAGVQLFKRGCMKRLGVDCPAKSQTVLSKITKNRSNIVCSDGLHVDSGYERIVYEFWLRRSLLIERNISIEYMYQNNKHVTFIDFKVENMLFEVKGAHLLQGCFDYAGVPIQQKLKVYSENNVIIITDGCGINILQQNNADVRCLDLALFKNMNERDTWSQILAFIKSDEKCLLAKSL